MELSDDRRLRQTVVQAILIVAAAAMVTGRIMTVHSRSGRTAALSANDRSRWATIRSLVEHGTFELDRVIFHPDGRRHGDWYSIDLVRHRGWDGREHYYSSKPPLLTVMLAGEYWLVWQVLGASLAKEPLFVMRLMLVLTNVGLLCLWLVLLASLLRRWRIGDETAMLVMTAAAFGTFLTTFAVTLNNHLPAAVAVMVCLWASWPLVESPPRGWWRPVVAGLAAGFAVANELPALSFCVFWGLILTWRGSLRTLVGFAIGALLVAVAFAGTTYLAHGSWSPPYVHRHDGNVVAQLDAIPIRAGQLTPELATALRREGLELSADSSLAPAVGEGRWSLFDPASHRRYALREGDRLRVHEWNQWYEYEGSYWLPGVKQGVDRGEPSRWHYAWHVVLGHHGFFSLTPIWLLACVGLPGWRSMSREARLVWLLTMVLTAVCLAFYVTRGLEDRNYGGVCCGFRWLFWLIPLWLLSLAAALPGLWSYLGIRWAAYAALGVSIASASYAALNPWSHPWLYEYWRYLGWF